VNTGDDMANISDVAKLSGFSKTTVSRVINGSPLVKPEKRARILQAMEELGYTPNPSARKLRGSVTTTIGVLVPRLVNPFFAELVDKIEQEAQRHGYNVLISQSNEEPGKELSFLNLLKTKQVDGLILTAVVNEWENILPYLKYGPIVVCNEQIDQTDVAVVRPDQAKGTSLGVQHLIEQGHSQIGYCTGGDFSEKSKGRDRNIAFLKILKKAHLPFHEDWIFTHRHTISDGKDVFKEWFKLSNRPTALFANSDEVACGIILAAKEHGINIPKELAVVGFDDQPIAEIITPSLTTIHQPIQQMAKQAVHCLLQQLSPEDFSLEKMDSLDMKLIIRQST